MAAAVVGHSAPPLPLPPLITALLGAALTFFWRFECAVDWKSNRSIHQVSADWNRDLNDSDKPLVQRAISNRCFLPLSLVFCSFRFYFIRFQRFSLACFQPAFINCFSIKLPSMMAALSSQRPAPSPNRSLRLPAVFIVTFPLFVFSF